MDGVRSGAFAEADWRALESLRLIAGTRTDYSSLTKVRTVDPRLSAAYELGPATITAALGVYHQVPDPLNLSATVGLPGAPPERAVQAVLGTQVGNGNEIARVELYDKQYRFERDRFINPGEDFTPEPETVAAPSASRASSAL